jgi:MFS family permease
MNGSAATETDHFADAFPSEPTSVRWRVLALLLAYSFMSWFNRISMSVAGDEVIMKSYGISEPEMGVVYSALLFSYALFMTPGGWFADRAGAWTALALMGFGSAVFVVGTGIVGWVFVTGTSLWLSLLLVRALMGLFTAPIYPASGQIIAHWLPFPQRAWANGAVMAAALVGIASTFYGFGLLIDNFGWQTAFLITGLVTGLVALVWSLYATGRPGQHPGVNPAEHDLILDRGRNLKSANIQLTGLAEVAAAEADLDSGMAAGKKPGRPAWQQLLRNRSLVLLTVSYAAVGYFEYLFYFWMRHYFDDELKMEKNASRMNATIVNLSMAVGMVLGGWVADRCLHRFGYRRGRALVPITGMLAGAAFLLLGIFATEPFWVVLWFSLALAAVGACEGPMWATAIELGGRQGGTAAGFFNTGGNAGGILAPVVTPVVSDACGWPVAISLGSVFCLIGVVLWFWIDPSERCPDEPGDKEPMARSANLGAEEAGVPDPGM